MRSSATVSSRRLSPWRRGSRLRARAAPLGRAPAGRRQPRLARAPRPRPRRRTSRRSCAAPLRSRGRSAAPSSPFARRRAELHLRGAVHRELAQHGHRAALGLVFDDFGRPSRAETAVEHRVEIGSLAARLRSQARRGPDLRPWAGAVREPTRPSSFVCAEKIEIELLVCWP